MERPRWVPDKHVVSGKEYLGRRAFGARVLEAHRLWPTKVFYEEPAVATMSLDRLGLKKVDEEVLCFLTPRAHKHAESKKSEFHSWAVFRGSEIAPSVRVAISPTPDEEDKDNPFHADMDLSAHGERHHRETLASHLAYLASKYPPAAPVKCDGASADTSE